MAMLRRKIAAGLFLIGEFVYAERTKDGKLVRRKAPMQGGAALNQRRRPTPALTAWQKQFCEQVDNAKWQELEAARLRSGAPTVAELCEIYLEIAAAEYAKEGEPRPSSATQNAAAFRRVAKACGCGEDDRVDGMTPAAIERWIGAFCGRYAAEEAERARTSAWSQLAQAKGLWTRWTAPYYAARSVKLPEGLFQWPTPKRNNAPSYRRPPDVLRAATAAWYNSLEELLPASWVAASLMLQFGMRPGDASDLRWDAFETAGDNNVVLRYVPEKTRGRTAKARAVTWPVSRDLYERIKRHGGADYVVPGSSRTARYNVYQDSLNPMMRTLGWDAKTYGKACYELRKLCVDAIYRQFGLERAVQISGDNASTILKFYADPNVHGLEPVDVSGIV
jgi:integrase